MPASKIAFNPNGPVNFSPYETVVVAATASSGSATFTSALSVGAASVMVFNETTHTIFVGFGVGSATAAAPTGTPAQDSTPIPAGGWGVLVKGNADTVAAIAPGGNGNVYFTTGEGA